MIRSNSAFSASIISLLFGAAFLFFFNQKLVYILYGYDPSIVGTGTVMSMQAVRETWPGALTGYLIVFIGTLLILVASGISLVARNANSLAIASATFLLSFLLTVTYAYVLVVSLFVPKRFF